MKRALFCLLLGATGCQDEMTDMMHSDRLPAHVPAAPTGHWWHPLVAAW